MATRADEVRELRDASTPEPQRRPRVGVLRSADLKAHHKVQRARAMIVLSVMTVAGALMLVAAGQAVVVSQQLQLDNTQLQLQQATAQNTSLQIQRAVLDSPTRILQLAQNKLGMVAPTNVVYLIPVNPGPTVGSIRNIVHP